MFLCISYHNAFSQRHVTNINTASELLMSCRGFFFFKMFPCIPKERLEKITEDIRILKFERNSLLLECTLRQYVESTQRLILTLVRKHICLLITNFMFLESLAPCCRYCKFCSRLLKRNLYARHHLIFQFTVWHNISGQRQRLKYPFYVPSTAVL